MCVKCNITPYIYIYIYIYIISMPTRWLVGVALDVFLLFCVSFKFGFDYIFYSISVPYGACFAIAYFALLVRLREIYHLQLWILDSLMIKLFILPPHISRLLFPLVKLMLCCKHLKTGFFFFF
jgi:hypothetical protein